MNLMLWMEINFRSFFKQGFLSLHIFCHCMSWILENKFMNLWWDIISITVQPVNDATLTTYKITPFSLSEKTHITECQTSEDFTIHTFHSEINSLKNKVNNLNFCFILILAPLLSLLWDSHRRDLHQLFHGEIRTIVQDILRIFLLASLYSYQTITLLLLLI